MVSELPEEGERQMQRCAFSGSVSVSQAVLESGGNSGAAVMEIELQWR